MDRQISPLRRCLPFLVSAAAAAAIGTFNPTAANASVTDNGVLLVGQNGPLSCAPLGFPGTWTLTGFYVTFGSYSPTGLTGGKTVAQILDRTSANGCLIGSESHVTVSGFSANPGSSWLVSITCQGITRTGASSAFSYSGSTAFWSWSALNFGFTNGANVSCSITHN